MNLPQVLALFALTLAQSAFARTPADPCRTKSRQMTLAKNCYTGDMVKSADGTTQFFAATPGEAPAVNYCYNSLVEIGNRPGQASPRIRVLKESKDGQFHVYDFSLPPEEVKKLKKDSTLLVLKGLKGECFSPTGDKEACSGGILKTLGFKDTAAPFILGVNKAGNAQYALTHLAHDQKELSTHPAKELEGVIVRDTAAITAQMVQDIRKRLATLANAKLALIRAGNSSPKKLSDASEQFRFCSMAFESFLKFQKLADPFTPAEKLGMNNLTSYMNNDPAFATNSRAPASSTPIVGKVIQHK